MRQNEDECQPSNNVDPGIWSRSLFEFDRACAFFAAASSNIPSHLLRIPALRL
jgi:hypothetical protein